MYCKALPNLLHSAVTVTGSLTLKCQYYSIKQLFSNLICPIVQNVFIDFKSKNLFQILGSTGSCIEGA